MDFRFALDTEVTFGSGSRRQIGTVAAAYGGRIGLVTGARSLEASGAGAEIEAALTDAGCVIATRESVAGEPDDARVLEAAHRLSEAGAEVVVAVGGGSVMDLAKAAAVVCGGTELGAALVGEPVVRRGVPVVAVPTTAGSGAEVSRGAIILDRSARRKRGLRGRPVAARTAIVDPELTVSGGSRVTAEAGLDAMAHAVESGVSRAASPLNVLLAGEALRLLTDAVPRALAEPQDLDARASAAYAALLMGINLATASTCLPHRLQYPVGAVTGTSHARGVAAILVPWLHRTQRHAPHRLGELARYAGLVHEETDMIRAARALGSRVEDWIDQIGMRTRLGELGLTRSGIGDLVPMVEGTLSNDPGPVDRDSLVELYRASL